MGVPRQIREAGVESKPVRCTMADDNAGKWARARAIVAEEEALREQYEDFKVNQALASRFSNASPADVLRMFQACENEKGQPLSQFEFEALCERWCAVFGELPPMGSLSVDAEPSDPLPADDTTINMKEVVRITGLSKSTIKRWVSDPTNDFPKPDKLSTRRIGWRAEHVKAWRKRIENAASGRKQ
jgi:predicted DNA-binding transcriptional regulator AlpA